MFNHLREGVKADYRDNRAAGYCSKGLSRRRITAFEIIHIGHRIRSPPPVSRYQYLGISSICVVYTNCHELTGNTPPTLLSRIKHNLRSTNYSSPRLCYTHTHRQEYTKPVYRRLEVQPPPFFDNV